MIKLTNFFNLFRRQEKQGVPLIDFIFDYADKSRRQDSYKRVFRSLARKLEAFSEEYHYTLNTDSIDERVAENFIYFLKEQNLRINTVRSTIAKLTVVLHRADREGYVVRFGISECPIKTESPTTVYLNELELKKIYELKLKREAEVVRDVFIIGCYTGLRYSDLTGLTLDNFVQGRIMVKTEKTGASVDIPIHPCVKLILEKYNYILPKQKTPQNFNDIVKRVCKRAGITEKIHLEYTEGFKKISKSVPKYLLVSSHTARRSLATNMYLSGEKTFRIMLITGHTTESSFFKYIRISREENAKELLKGGFFTGESMGTETDKN